MPLLRNGMGCAKVWLVWLAILAGCTSGPEQARPSLPVLPPAAADAPFRALESQTPPARCDVPGRPREITPVHYEEQGADLARSSANGEGVFVGQTELSLPLLVSEVQRRNPSLQAAQAAWAAAAQRYPQVVALDDPVFQSMVAPGSFSSDSSVQASYFVGIAQKVPWSGKRALRGQAAQAAAMAASLDSQDVQLRLTEAARLAFFEYYLVRRDLELNAANVDAVERFHATAKVKFESNQVTQQDVLQADVEIGILKSRRIELDQNEKIAVARINTLLHREPQLSLPPPPQQLEVGGELPDIDSLRQLALEQRPDLKALAARIQAEQASVALAIKEFYPDFEFMGRYDQFWTDVVQRSQVGMYVNIPLNQSRRKAAVCEAMFRVNKLQAEYDAQVDSIRSDVQTAFARVEGSFQTVRLYADTILPAAQDNVAAAYAGYEAGNVDFLRLVEAERQLIELQEKHQEAVAEFHRRNAELQRVFAAPLAATDDRQVSGDQDPGS